MQFSVAYGLMPEAAHRRRTPGNFMPRTVNNNGISPGLRNVLIVLGFFALTLGATAVEISLKSHQERPLFGNVVALALLNINVLLLAVLVLLIGRQLVKLYIERKTSPFGAGYRSKLTVAFVALSIIPAGILFVVAIKLLTGGVEYWFGPRVEGTVKKTISLAEEYKRERQDNLLHLTEAIADRVDASSGAEALRRVAVDSMDRYGLDLVEFYGPSGKLLVSSGSDRYETPSPAKKFIDSALDSGRATSFEEKRGVETVYGAAAYYGEGGGLAGVAVTGSAVPETIASGLSDISGFYREYWDLRTFKNPLKESYTLSLILFMLVVVFAAIWVGLYMSKDITVPITSLAEAADRISKGEYDVTIEHAANDEVGALVSSFKRMARDLGISSERLREANASLTASNALLEQRRMFIETVLENVHAGVLTIDRSGKISTANRAAGRIMGADESSIIGRGYREVFGFHQLDEIRERISELPEGGEGGVEKEIQITINRRTLNLRLFVSTLRDAAGAYLGILVVFDDLTGLIKAQRAAAWREVARRIAHEIKNPLTPIQLSAQRLRKRYMDGAGDYESIIDDCTRTIIAEVESMKVLVDEFSDFARMPVAKPASCDLHAIAEDAATLFGGAHPDINVVREYAEDMPSVNVDGEQIKRALVNIFQNAVAAMEGKGTVWLKTGYDGSTGTLSIEVADDGPGILPEDRDRLFQPYFSKNKSGTGLGLAIVNRIVSDHGGSIRVEGNRPRGARFIIELPVSGPEHA